VIALVLLGIVAVGVGSCVYVVAGRLGPALSMSMRIQNDPRVRSASYSWYNGVETWTIDLAPGVPDSDGPTVACQVVRPAFQGTQFENDEFRVYDSEGFVVASEETPCG